MLEEQRLLSLLREKAIENSQVYWQQKLTEADGQFHIAIMVEPYLSRILKGEKTMESRFSKKKISPWNHIAPGDIVILKKSGGEFVAVFEAAQVIFQEVNHDIQHIQLQYGRELCIDDDFWQSKQDCKYATLIAISHLFAFCPFSLSFPNRRSWIDLSPHQITLEESVHPTHLKNGASS